VLCRASPAVRLQLMSQVAGEQFEVAAHHDSVGLEIRGVLPPCPCLAPAMADDLRDQAFAPAALSILTANVGIFPRLARGTELLLVRVQVERAPCLARATAAVRRGLGRRVVDLLPGRPKAGFANGARGTCVHRPPEPDVRPGAFGLLRGAGGDSDRNRAVMAAKSMTKLRRDVPSSLAAIGGGGAISVMPYDSARWCRSAAPPYAVSASTLFISPTDNVR